MANTTLSLHSSSLVGIRQMPLGGVCGRPSYVATKSGSPAGFSISRWNMTGACALVSLNPTGRNKCCLDGIVAYSNIQYLAARSKFVKYMALPIDNRSLGEEMLVTELRRW